MQPKEEKMREKMEQKKQDQKQKKIVEIYPSIAITKIDLIALNCILKRQTYHWIFFNQTINYD